MSKRKPKGSRKVHREPSSEKVERQALEILAEVDSAIDRKGALPDTSTLQHLCTMLVWFQHKEPDRCMARYFLAQLERRFETIAYHAGLPAEELEAGSRRAWKRLFTAAREAAVHMTEGDWSRPFSLSEIAERLFKNREMYRKVKGHLTGRLQEINRQSYRVRLDVLDKTLRDALTKS